MPTILDPSATRAIAVRPLQPVRLEASAASDWYARTNAGISGAWSTIGSNVTSLVYTTASSVIRRFTFDDVQIQLTNPGAGAPPVTDTTGLRLNLCEGPVANLQVTSRLRNEALEEPPLRPDEDGRDDPSLGVPLLMPGANRD